MQLRFKSKSTKDPPKYINALKPITSREIRYTFLEVKEKLWRN
ncbi:MAG: IS200/IS605 family transposase, partial [Candidatus Hodarchaeota archaeon]